MKQVTAEMVLKAMTDTGNVHSIADSLNEQLNAPDDPFYWLSWPEQEAGCPIIGYGEECIYKRTVPEDGVLVENIHNGSTYSFVQPVESLSPDFTRFGKWKVSKPLTEKPVGLHDKSKVAVWDIKNGIDQVMPNIRLAGSILEWEWTTAFAVLESYNDD